MQREPPEFAGDFSVRQDARRQSQKCIKVDLLQTGNHKQL
jgi:hypothetical protein